MVWREKDDSSPDMCPWERTQNIREITWLEICPGCEWFEPYIGHTSPGVWHREEKHPYMVAGLCGLTGGLWEARTHPSRSMCSGACSQATMKRTDGDCICRCLFSQQLPTLTHALLTPCGRSALEQGLPWPGRQLGCGKQRCMWPRAASGWKSRGHAHGGHLHRQRIRRRPDLWWRRECHSRWPSMCPEPMRASLPNSTPLQQGRDSRRWGKWSAVRDQEVRPESMFKQGRRCYWWWWHRWHMLEVAWISVSSQPGDLLLLYFSNQNMLLLALCGKGCSAGRGERTYLREHSQIWPDIQGFCSRNLGSHPAPNRTVKATEEKEVSASHLASDLIPLYFRAIGAGTP